MIYNNKNNHLVKLVTFDVKNKTTTKMLTIYYFYGFPLLGETIIKSLNRKKEIDDDNE